MPLDGTIGPDEILDALKRSGGSNADAGRLLGISGPAVAMRRRRYADADPRFAKAVAKLGTPDASQRMAAARGAAGLALLPEALPRATPAQRVAAACAVLGALEPGELAQVAAAAPGPVAALAAALQPDPRPQTRGQRLRKIGAIAAQIRARLQGEHGAPPAADFADLGTADEVSGALDLLAEQGAQLPTPND